MIAVRAQSASNNDGEGAVQGFFTGIIKAPVALVGSIGSSIFPVQGTPLDREMLDESVLALLEDDILNAAREWMNPESRIRGKAALISKSDKDGRNIRVVNIQAWKENKRVAHLDVTLSGTEEGQWEVVDQKKR
ncbi:MAG: hypothetical protein R3F07_06955 [Opitutaceae bacterium]